jgi:hypothetical protein
MADLSDGREQTPPGWAWENAASEAEARLADYIQTAKNVNHDSATVNALLSRRLRVAELRARAAEIATGGKP